MWGDRVDGTTSTCKQLVVGAIALVSTGDDFDDTLVAGSKALVARVIGTPALDAWPGDRRWRSDDAATGHPAVESTDVVYDEAALLSVAL